MPLSSQKPALEHILRTSQVPHRVGLYTIGPFGYRVGFAFQQERALNLVLALRTIHGRDHLKKLKIAVVGGGVAGVTAYCALVAYGCSEAKLFEKSAHVLSLQEDADHRLVHPNYNKWPGADSLNAFTNLQLLNWHAAPANEVIIALKKEYEELMAANAMTGSALTGKHFYEHYLHPGKHPIGLRFRDGTDDQFDIAIFATGFGDEHHSGGHFKSYWQKDLLPDGPVIKDSIQIVGTGDGALVDVVRCYTKLVNDFWKIPLGLIARLRSPSHLSILTGPLPRGAVTDDEKDTNWEEKIRNHEVSIRPLTWQVAKTSGNRPLADRLCQQEQEFYLPLMERVCKERPAVRDFLEAALKKPPDAPAEPPQIRGLNATPFEPTSAPVNKLLLAYLMNTGRLKPYERFADPTEGSREIERILAQPKSVNRIDIVRTGSKPPVEEHFGLAPEERAVLSILASSGMMQVPPDADLVMPSVKASAGGDSALLSARLAESRVGTVSSYFCKYFRAEKNCATFYRGTNKESASFVVSKPNLADKEISEKLLEVGGLERKVYDFPVAWKASRGKIRQGT